MTFEEEFPELAAQMDEAAASKDPVKVKAAVEAGLTVLEEKGGSSIAEVQAVCNVVRSAVKLAIGEILFLAKELGTPVVPVEVLEMVMDTEPAACIALMDLVGMNPAAFNAAAPDDISELFNEEGN